MIALHVVYDDGGLESRLAAAPAAIEISLEQAIRFLSDRVKGHLEADAPVDTGRLRDSIDYTLAGLIANFFAVYYGVYVIGGTSPHVIEPHLPPSALHFFWDKAGQEVWFARVHHPGTQPEDFRAPALVQSKPDVDLALERLWEEIRRVL